MQKRATAWKTTIVTASQVGGGLVRMDYYYFYQTATLNICVFLFLQLFSQKTNVTIVFSVKISFRITLYLNFEKKMDYCCFHKEPFNYQNADHPQKFTEWHKRVILWEVKINHQSTAPKLTIEITNGCHRHINPKMVRKVVQKEGFHWHVACKKRFINEHNQKQWLEFVYEHYLKDTTFPSDVVLGS